MDAVTLIKLLLKAGLTPESFNCPWGKPCVCVAVRLGPSRAFTAGVNVGLALALGRFDGFVWVPPETAVYDFEILLYWPTATWP
jgi:hypothetical protein